MSHLYFHIREGNELIEDLEGAEYTSLGQARNVAVKSAREIMAARVIAGKSPGHCSFEIVDASGRVVLVMPFLDALGEK
jgi:hypothetical protein